MSNYWENSNPSSAFTTLFLRQPKQMYHLKTSLLCCLQSDSITVEQIERVQLNGCLHFWTFFFDYYITIVYRL